MEGVRLERSCKDWIRYGHQGGGVQAVRAWFAGSAFDRHRHDTYGIAVTDHGVQAFGYRGARHHALPGDAIVLHPDELHDGGAGTDAGFGYRIVYVDPALVAAAAGALPFVREPVVRSARLSRAVADCFDDPEDVDALALELAEALVELAGGELPARRIDIAALDRARELLHAAADRVVRSVELEAASGLSRYELARQFRARFGTSPYRYSLQRRLEAARQRLGTQSTAEVALEGGFADQAHFTRQFKRAFGVTPARYAFLTRGAT